MHLHEGGGLEQHELGAQRHAVHLHQARQLGQRDALHAHHAVHIKLTIASALAHMRLPAHAQQTSAERLQLSAVCSRSGNLTCMGFMMTWG